MYLTHVMLGNQETIAEKYICRIPIWGTILENTSTVVCFPLKCHFWSLYRMTKINTLFLEPGIWD